MAESRPVALVTGGARRVGRAIVERLARGGFDVAFTYMQSESAAMNFADELAARGVKAAAISADLTHLPAGALAAESAFRQSFSRLDVLVNNASLYEQADLATTTVEQMRRLMAIHVEAPLLLCQRFAADLRASGGHVINMVDLLAERPWPQYLPYCASKAALSNLTLGLARELAPEVTVNGIAPGVVQWPEHFPQESKDAYLRRVPLGRPGSGEDVAETVHFLCTGGKYITGQILRLDGGRSIT